MLTTEERRKLRDEKVVEELSKRPKQPKRKPKRKRGVRPPNAKMIISDKATKPLKAEKLPETKKAKQPAEKSKK